MLKIDRIHIGFFSTKTKQWTISSCIPTLCIRAVQFNGYRVCVWNGWNIPMIHNRYCNVDMWTFLSLSLIDYYYTKYEQTDEWDGDYVYRKSLREMQVPSLYIMNKIHGFKTIYWCYTVKTKNTTTSPMYDSTAITQNAQTDT